MLSGLRAGCGVTNRTCKKHQTHDCCSWPHCLGTCVSTILTASWGPWQMPFCGVFYTGSPSPSHLPECFFSPWMQVGMLQPTPCSHRSSEARLCWCLRVWALCCSCRRGPNPSKTALTDGQTHGRAPGLPAGWES